MWFIGVVVEQETSAPPPTKNPGSAPVYRYVLPHLEGFLRLFVWKRTGIHFAHFGLESGIVFEGTTGLYERLYRFNPKWARKKNMRIRNGFEEFFVWSSFVVFLYIAYNF